MVRRLGIRVFGSVLFVAWSSAAVSPQQQPAFEAAVFHVNRSGEDNSSIGQRPGGQYVMTNGPISMLLMNAFQPQHREIVGAPSWVNTERYDFRATSLRTTSSDDLRQMLRTVLTDRLKLRAHLEPREQPVSFLVTVRADRRLGPQIERTTRDCASAQAADKAGVPRPDLTLPANGAPPCGMRSGEGELLGGGVSMDLLARNLGFLAGGPVFDRTGVDGIYDLTLKFVRDPGVSNPDGVSLVTALREQLGLRLEPGRAPLQTLVIDHIERPSEN